MNEESTNLCLQALALEAKGEPIPEDMQDELIDIVGGEVLMFLARAGTPIDVLERMFRDEEWTIVLRFEEATGTMTYGVEWPDEPERRGVTMEATL